MSPEPTPAEAPAEVEAEGTMLVARFPLPEPVPAT
jgi:hypothetical protein